MKAVNKNAFPVLSVILMALIFSFSNYTIQANDNKYNSTLERKVKKIVLDAYDFVMTNQDDWNVILKAFQENPLFLDKKNEIYMFMHSYDKSKKEAICIAHGVRINLIGKNMWSLRTPTGRMLFHEIIQLIEEKGGGWLEYDWLNPYTNKIQTKHSFFKGVILKNGQKAWVGSGVWK